VASTASKLEALNLPINSVLNLTRSSSNSTSNSKP